MDTDHNLSLDMPNRASTESIAHVFALEAHGIEQSWLHAVERSRTGVTGWRRLLPNHYPAAKIVTARAASDQPKWQVSRIFEECFGG